ncbi:MAG: hypothetical protein ACI3ZT_04425 [Candidatus Cryptobacteroides sp.]
MRNISIPAVIVAVAVLIAGRAEAQEAMQFAAIGKSLQEGGPAALLASPADKVFQEHRIGVSASYLSYCPDGIPASYINASGTYMVMENLSVSAAFTYGIGESYETVNTGGFSIGAFTPSYYEVSAGVSCRPFRDISFGVNLEYLGEKLSSGFSAGSFAADVAAMWNHSFGSSSMKCSAGVFDVGTKVKSDSGEKFRLPSSARLSVGYEFRPSSAHTVGAGIQGECYFSGNISATAGLKYAYTRILTVEAVYHYGDKTVVPTHISLGAGINVFGFVRKSSKSLCLNFRYLLPASSGGDVIKGSFQGGISFGF